MDSTTLSDNTDGVDVKQSFSDTFQQVWENPIGIAIIIVTMIVTFILFPPPKKKGDEEDDDDTNDPTLKDKYLTFTTYKPKSTLLDDLKVLKVMWFTKIVGDDLQQRLNNFYQNQASLYDAYRIRMLHGRPLMLKSVVRNLIPPNATTKKRGIVWVDLACGTGYNVENFRNCLECFHRIYLLDLCVPLCEVAQKERADKYNKNSEDDSKKKIHVIHDDATNFDCKELPEAGTVDLVTISYSLVMIPNWKKSIENAKRLLKPNTGMIAICDFTLDPNQNTYMKSFWKRTFESDHVYLNEEHLKTLYKEFDVVDAYGGYGPLPYTPFFLQPAYYYFVGTKKKK